MFLHGREKRGEKTSTSRVDLGMYSLASKGLGENGGKCRRECLIYLGGVLGASRIKKKKKKKPDKGNSKIN